MMRLKASSPLIKRQNERGNLPRFFRNGCLYVSFGSRLVCFGPSAKFKWSHHGDEYEDAVTYNDYDADVEEQRRRV